jgi:hypothetical protein
VSRIEPNQPVTRQAEYDTGVALQLTLLWPVKPGAGFSAAGQVGRVEAPVLVRWPRIVLGRGRLRRVKASFWSDGTFGVLPPSTNEAISEAEGSLGLRLPGSLLELLWVRNGGLVGNPVERVADRRPNVMEEQPCPAARRVRHRRDRQVRINAVQPVPGAGVGYAIAGGAAVWPLLADLRS